MAGRVIKWGILGPGAIAREFLEGARGSATGEVVALGTRNPDRPDIAHHFPGLAVHGTYEALIADRDVDAIYIATPHAFHAEWAIKAAEAGKHVLSEKPAGMETAQVEAMFAAATAAGTFLGEAYMYRLHPLTGLILQLVEQGKIGELRMIRSNFGFSIPSYHSGHRLFDPSLGGGAILDVGGYPMSMARLIIGHALGRDDVIPTAISGFSRHGQTGVDEISTVTAHFPNGVIAQMSASIALDQDNCLHLMGTLGRLEIDDFWFGSGKRGGTAHIRFVPIGGPVEVIALHEPRSVYSFQFEAANAAIAAGETRFRHPGMSQADSIANARALDMWRGAALVLEPPLGLPPVVLD